MTVAAAGNPGLARLSIFDTLRVACLVLLPPLAQGLIIRRPRVVGLAERLDADRRSGRVLRRIRERYGPGPLRLRIPRRDLALALSAPDVERLLAGTPHPFTAATVEKKASLRHFQPDGLLISDEARRARRRPFNETVLGFSDPTHRLQSHVLALVDQELDELLHGLPTGPTGKVLAWQTFNDAYWRVVRQLVLGRTGRNDVDLSRLVERLRRRANWAYFAPLDRRGVRRLEERLRSYVARAEQDSLAGITGTTPASPGVAPAGQMPHWFFGFDEAGMATYRALALLASHPAVADDLATSTDRSGPPALARAVLLESLRLWPTTMLLLRESVEPTIWASGRAAAGTGFIIVSSYVHREAARPVLADIFAPQIWTGGTTPDDSFVAFSSGPASCAGRTVVLDLAGALLYRLASEHHLRLEGDPVRLTPGRPLPRTLDQTTLRIALTPRTGAGR